MTPLQPEKDQATYFAYGTLLELAEIHKYCPTSKRLGIYRLQDYRLGFAACGPDPSLGGCTLIEAPGNVMYGILYHMPPAERKNLEKVSGLEKGLWAAYDITLLDEDGNRVAADTFIVPNPGGPHVPPASYIRPIKAGAREIPLPADYIAQLDAICEGKYTS